ncbi:hypothetical protein SprV_0100024600 [Sparganum proliferum]
MSTKGARTQVPSDSPKLKNSRPSEGKQADDGSESSYIDSLFFALYFVILCQHYADATAKITTSRRYLILASVKNS